MNAPVAAVDQLVVQSEDSGHVILPATSARFTAGRITAVTGESGAGKTTLLLSLLGHLPPGAHGVSGTVELAGHDVLSLNPSDLRRLRRDHVAFVGQDPGAALNPTMTVGALIREVAHDRGQVAEVLDLVRLPSSAIDRRPGQLSGGQQRRVALARALVRRVDLLLVDEPFAGLDPAARRQVAAVLRDLASSTRTAIGVSGHDLPTLEALCDDRVHVAGAAPQRALTVRTATNPPPGTTALLVAAGLHLSHGDTAVLRNLDLEVQTETLTAVVGPSGAGKTTLARVLTGMEPRATGTLTLHGEPLPLDGTRRPANQRRRIQLVPQDPRSTLNPRHTIGQTIRRPVVRHHGRRAATPQHVAELLTAVGLHPDLATRYPTELSGGQRQRVALARAIAAEPDVLICDEITSALDRDTAITIMDLLSDLMTRRHMGLVLISHDEELVHAYAHRTLHLTPDHTSHAPEATT